MGPESRVGRDIPDTIRLRSDLEDTAGRCQTHRGCGADDETRTRDIDDGQSVAGGSATSTLRADDETRTRDIDLGKVALYQLSYIRMPGTGTGIVTGRSRPTSYGDQGDEQVTADLG